MIGADDQLLAIDELVARGAAAGIQTWPVVLDLHAPEVVETDCAAADDEQMLAMLRLLTRAELLLEIRVVSASPVRACIAVGESSAVQAIRRGDEIALRELGDGLDSFAAAVADAVGARPAADLRPASVPVAEAAAGLASATEAGEYVDALHACGIRDRDAVTIGAALHGWTSRTEIIALRRGVPSPAAVVILDAAAGRVVISPSRSPDGVLWSTFASGTRQRLRQALSLLVESLDDGP